MRRFFRILAAGCAAVVALAATSATAQRAKNARRAVLISLDGFGADNLDDPKVPLTNIRALVEEGARAERMTVATPSVTWPNHTTLVTGVYPARHGVLANGEIEPSTGERPLIINPRRTKQELCRVPTLYDAAKGAGLTTAEVNWPVTRGATTLDFSMPDHPDPLRYTTPTLLQELQVEKILPAATDEGFRDVGQVTRDELWTRTATHLIRRHKPNLLLLHLLNTDGTQHAHGPGTTEAATALALADRMVGDVLQALRDAGLSGGTAVFVTADHGFARVTKSIRPNVRLRTEGLVRPDSATPDRLEWDAQSISEGGVALVYVPNARFRPELVAKTRKALEGLEGVEGVLPPEEYSRLGLPVPEKSAQAPTFLLTAKDGYSFGNEVTGPEVVTLPRPNGTHGYAHTNVKMDGALVAAGPGIKKGARLSRVRNVDVAPTIARLLGIALPDTDGQALDGMLD